MDTLAPSYLSASTNHQAVAAAGFAEDIKKKALSFIPVAMETLGPINDKDLEFISDLALILLRQQANPESLSSHFSVSS